MTHGQVGVRPLFGLGVWGWALLALGLALRLAYAAYALKTGISDPSCDGYEAIAINLVEHRGYAGLPRDTKPSAAREPVFPLLIALIYKLFGRHPYLVLAFQSALNVGTCLLLALLAQRLSGMAAARLTLWIALFYPYFIFYCAYFYRETCLAAAVAVALYLVGCALRHKSPAVASAAGLALGLCAVSMSTFLLVDALLAPWVIWRLAKSARPWLCAAAFVAALAALPAAWIGRNYHVFHRFIPGSTLGGYNLYAALIVPEEDRGTARETLIEQTDPFWPKLIRLSPLMVDDGSQQDAFLAAAKAYAREHPWRVVTHAAKQVAKLWRFYPYERRYQHSFALIKTLSLLSDGWLIPLGLWGLWLLRRRGPEAAFSLLLLACATAAYAIVAAIVRYRLPLMAPLIVGAAAALAERVVPWFGTKAPRILLPALMLLPVALPVRAQDAPADADVFGPMEAEMARSLSRLRQDAYGPPYFLAYRLTDERRAEVAASFGSRVRRLQDQQRQLFVEARYGDRSLDNTDLSFKGWAGQAARAPEVLRQGLWQLTDEAYKNAISGYLEKKAKRVTQFEPERLDDFSLEPSTRYTEAQSPLELELDRAQALVERLSAVLRRYPDVYDGRASIELAWSRRYLLTSEGTRIATPSENVPGTLDLWAATRAADGMRLTSHRRWVLRRLEDLPAEPKLVKAAEGLAEELSAQRHAAVQVPLAAPAILDPEMTGVLFHEALGHKLEGQRQRDPQQSQLFRDLVGKRIIPEFLSLWDDPTLESFNGQPLHGFYRFDDEGVPAQRVVLVDNGVLKSFLMSRWPVHGFARSNGHGRADAKLRPMGRMANLMVRSERPVRYSTLKQRLMELARKAGKPFGFLLVGALGGENPNRREAAQTLEVRPRLVYRVDSSTGRETLVRGVSMVGTPLLLLNRIVAAADDYEVANGFYCGAESGMVAVDQIAPSVLVSEIELQRLPEDLARPPILPSPFNDPETLPGVKAANGP